MMLLRRMGVAAWWTIFVWGVAYPQGTSLGTVRGEVTDATGAVIPGASVEITDLSTAFKRRTVTDSSGNYEATGLIYGEYEIVVSAEGFAPAKIDGITLRTASDVRVDARLAPLGPGGTVTVTASTTELQSGTPNSIESLDTRALLALPRDSRDIYSFLYLNPNVTQGVTNGAFKYSGAQTYGASFSLDGQRSSGGIFGDPTASQPSLEAVAELNVLTNHFSAEYAGVANIRVETKRGTRTWHGSLFYNNKNSALATWDYRDKLAAASTKPRFNLTEAAGSLSGPLAHRKDAFFMLAYERQWL